MGETYIFVGNYLAARRSEIVSFIRGLGIMCQDAYDALEYHEQVCPQDAVAKLLHL
jgi:hypothetical protein